jgi:hypothetical protein
MESRARPARRKTAINEQLIETNKKIFCRSHDLSCRLPPLHARRLRARDALCGGTIEGLSRPKAGNGCFSRRSMRVLQL